MKILLLSASPRGHKSQTLFLAKEILNGCSGAESEIIQLHDLQIKFCQHCELCHKKILACPLKDDVRLVLNKMMEADGIILASPNYIDHITGALKSFLDRSSHFIHCLRLLEKYVVGCVTSGSGQDQPVLDYIKHYANICAAQYVGGISSAAMSVREKMKEAYKLGETLFQDISEKKVFPDQMKIINEHREHFRKMMRLAKDEWPGEYQYWLEKGWL